MSVRTEDITIAVTVYNRRDYVLQSIESALAQTVPVKVIVVEDCGPDGGMRDFIVQKFGDRIEYFRNPMNRGLFDNWNACMEYCRTPWFSILHDDDYLFPNFIETVLALAKEAPGRSLYYGRRTRLEPDGKFYPPDSVPWAWRDLNSRETLLEHADESILGFPGNLIRIADAQFLGGFNKHSLYTGDWDMWMRLAIQFGGAESATVVAVGRSHSDLGRASTGVIRNGWKWLLDNVQRKRNIRMLKEKDIVLAFDRAKMVRRNPVPQRQLLDHAQGFSPSILAYNWWLLTQSRPPHWRYAILQRLLRVAGPKGLRMASRWASYLKRFKHGA